MRRSSATMGRPPKREDRQEIDGDIFARRIMEAIAKTQEADRCGFRDALHKVRARYDHLRRIAPDRLPPPLEYWDGYGKMLRPRRAVVAPPGGGSAPARSPATPAAAPTPKRKGERRIVVDGVVYYWRIPRRANTSQVDLMQGVVSIVRRADGTGGPWFVEFPQAHPDANPDAPPVRPADVANAIRAIARAPRGSE